MSIGSTLAQARRDAGLTVTQVSERTRIRETIIRGIEHDDYSACGGDFYARGHLRSIAKAIGTDPDPLIGEYDATLRAPEEITAAEALRPLLPIGIDDGPEPADAPDIPRRNWTARGPRLNWTVVLALVLLVVLGFLGYQLAFGSGPAPRRASDRPGHHPGRAVVHPRPTSARPSTPAAPPVTTVTPVSAAAFGPGGTAQGDNPQDARLALAGHPATPWHTNWYATPRFGNLQSGTGLILDLGHPVTISSAQVTLGSAPGADLQLRVGNAPVLADLRPAAEANGAGGVVQLHPAAPVSGRYVLIWFTSLPPDGNGTYQASISGVTLRGQG